MHIPSLHYNVVLGKHYMTPLILYDAIDPLPPVARKHAQVHQALLMQRLIMLALPLTVYLTAFWSLTTMHSSFST